MKLPDLAFLASFDSDQWRFWTVVAICITVGLAAVLPKLIDAIRLDRADARKADAARQRYLARRGRSGGGDE